MVAIIRTRLVIKLPSGPKFPPEIMFSADISTSNAG